MQIIYIDSVDSKNFDSLNREDVITARTATSFIGKTVEYFRAAGELEQKLKRIFQVRMGLEGDRIFSKVWSFALAEAGIRWKRSPFVSVETLQKIDVALRKVLVYQGRGIDTQAVQTQDTVVHSMMQYLIGNGQASTTWLSKKNIRAILFAKDHALQKAMGEELRAALIQCVNNPPIVGSSQEAIFEAFTGHIMALIPYCYPHVGDTFTVPVKRDGQWTHAEYRVDHIINMASEKYGTPIPLFGLVSDTASPILCCMGTTYPAADGFVATILADFTPGFSVGHKPYMEGQGKLNEWMQGKDQLQVYGMSLGGAFALHVLRDHAERLHSIHAFNPAGLYPELWTTSYDSGVKVNIYTQQGDLVSYMGAFPTGNNVEVFRFMRGIKGHSENALSAHARVYAGADFVTMCKLNASIANAHRFRKSLTRLHRTLSGFAYFTVLCYFQFAKGVIALRRGLGLTSMRQVLKDRAIHAITLEDLESVDEGMQGQYGDSLQQRFSWSVLGEFYKICRQKKFMSDEEASDPDWGRRHFMDASLEIRKASIARVISTLR